MPLTDFFRQFHNATKLSYDMNNKSQRINTIFQKVKDDIDDLEEEEIIEIASFAENGSESIRGEALVVLYFISEQEPIRLVPVLPVISGFLEDHSAMDHVKERAIQTAENIREDPAVQEYISQRDDNKDTDTQSNDIYSKSARAESSTVTKDRLAGQERYFYNVTSFTKPDEQPHFLFALTKSMLAANGSVLVDKHGSRRTLVDRKKTGSLLISDHGVRILTEAGRWGIAYQSITGVSTDTSPTPTLRIVSSGEVYEILVAKSIHEHSQVSEAADFIRKVINSI